MVPVTEFACGQRFPFQVVFTIGSRDHDGCRPRAFKQHSFKGGQSGRVKMFDDFHYCGSIKTSQSLVAVNQRAVHQAQAFLLHGRHTLVMQTVF